MKKTYISPVQKCIEIDAEDLIAGSPESAPTMNNDTPAVQSLGMEVKADRGGLWDEEW